MIDVALLLLAAVVAMATVPKQPDATDPPPKDAAPQAPTPQPPAAAPPAAATPTGEIPEPQERGGGLPDFIPGEDHPAGEPLEKVPEAAPGAPPAPEPAAPAPPPAAAKPPEVEVEVPDFLEEPAAPAAPAPAAAVPPAPVAPPPPAAPQPEQGLGIFTREQLIERGRAVYGDTPADATAEEIAAHTAACLKEGLQQEQWAFTVAARTARALQQGDQQTAVRTAEEEKAVLTRRNRNSAALRDEFYRLTPELAHVRDSEAEPLMLALSAMCLANLRVLEVGDLTREQFVKVLPLIRQHALAAFGKGAFPAPLVPPGAQPASVEATGVVEQHSPGFAETAGGPTVPPNLDARPKGDPDLADFDEDQLAGRPDLRKPVAGTSG